MSIDLEWDKLDSSLSSTLVDALNRQLVNTLRPSFIGPVEVTSFDFGSACPDIELVDMCDIYRDFLEDDDEDLSESAPAKITQGLEDDDGFEWVSRRAVGRGVAEEAPTYHHLPPHVRYGRGPSSEFFGSVSPGLQSPRDLWNGGVSSLPNIRDLRSIYGSSMSPHLRSPVSESSPPAANLPTPPIDVSTHPRDANEQSPFVETSTDSNSNPNLQLHLHVTWNSNLRLTITTSLLINYPSPMFMSLPVKLSITGLLFNGELAVAYEGQRRRVHMCILDDLDPYGPTGDRHKRDSVSSTPPDPDDEASVPPKATKPLPVGLRVLPSIFIESEIGQADKHVLKNVTRVERFIQDVIRKTVEEELVFPNFHTLLLGE